MTTSSLLRRSAGLRALPALAVSLLAIGCGGDGTHRLSGKVTFKGQPVPAGKIYFAPDGGKGNTGPTGYAEIKDGQYDTSAAGGAGVAKGPLIVTIDGFDPTASAPEVKGDTSGETVAKTLFAHYETTVEVTESTTKDFDVPESAAKPVETGERPTGGMIVP